MPRTSSREVRGVLSAAEECSTLQNRRLVRLIDLGDAHAHAVLQLPTAADTHQRLDQIEIVNVDGHVGARLDVVSTDNGVTKFSTRWIDDNRRADDVSKRVHGKMARREVSGI